PDAEDTAFFTSGKSYIDALWTAPQGNAYWILAHQYIAAELNVAAGASIPSDVLDVWSAAKDVFETYTPSTLKADRTASATAKSLAGILDDYNNGVSGPGHCPETSTSNPTDPPA